MAQQTNADDTSTDPELLATTMDEADDSLTIVMSRDEMREACRDEMREACRDWDLDGYSGTKSEMADTMLEQAPEKSAGLLLEEGVEITGDLADAVNLAPAGATDADTGQEDSDDEAENEAENEDDDEESTSQQGSLAGDLLQRSPEDYGYTAKLQMTSTQTAVVKAAFEDLDASQAEVAEAADCTQRYANSTLNRWRGAADEVQAMQDEGVQVPDEYREEEVLN